MYKVDFIAFICFVFCWFGYAIFSDIKKEDDHSIFKIMYDFRIRWMDQMIYRKDRTCDARVISSLMQSVTFFASTSIFIIAGLISIMSSFGKANEILGNIPFTTASDPILWKIKSILLIIIFIYVFFKNSWALRQLNYCFILLVSAPVLEENEKMSDDAAIYTRKIAKLFSNASRHFDLGIRGYYFGFAALSWLINPYLFILTSVLVLFVTYRREFMSKALQFLHYKTDQLTK